ncbi:MAG: acyltransferase family protein, partial [Sulfitobacter sp.]|nr:acyltransferase family protein [Sulfitobacter sp.]
MKYRGEIDGLRAVAVVPVIFFHAGVDIFSGGYIGVDVFFVISGYLITSILLHDLQKQQFSLLTFYERRARRILPALCFVVLCCIPFAWLWMMPSELEDFGLSLVGVATFTSNILFWQQSGYFAASAELKPLLHTWSLAVEEQYYIFFPIFLAFVWRVRRSLILASFIVLGAASLALAQWATQNMPTANYYLAPMRFWEIVAGSICAVLLWRDVVRPNVVAATVGIALVV